MRWPSHISAEDCQYVWAVVDIDFFVRFVFRAEIVAFFFCRRRIPNSSPVCSGTFIIQHWEKNCSFPKNSGAHFSFIRSVIKICRCRRFNSCKSEKSSLRANLERAIIFLRKQGTGSSSHHTGFTFGPTQCCRYHRPTHLQFRPNRLLKTETERLFNSMKGIMIDHEQLNPLVGLRSLALPSPHRERIAMVFFFFLQRVTFEFWISIVICKLLPIPRRASFCYCLKRKSLADAHEN